jgi:DNA-binding transcriptional LysR family regulator
MEIHQLRCFVAVAEELHFGRAAQRLHLTPSPVSRIIKDLEAELGVALFLRHYHRVELTDSGRALEPEVRRILEAVDRLKIVASRSDGAAHSRVMRLGAAHLAPPSDVDDFVDVVRRISELPFDIEFGTSAELLAKLKQHELDIVLVHLPVHGSNFTSRVTSTHAFQLVMRSDDALAERPSARLSDLSERVFTVPPLALQPAAMSRLHHLVQAAGITSLVEMPDSDPFKLAAHIRSTSGITLTVDPGLGGPAQIFADPAYAVIDLVDDIGLSVGAVCNTSTLESDHVVARITEQFG